MEDNNNLNNPGPENPSQPTAKPAEGASGVSFVEDKGLSKPPMEGVPAEKGEEPEPGAGEPEEAAPGPSSKEPVAISVDFVEITLGSLGTIAFQFTGYSPFQFSQKELQTIANLFAMCEIKAPAQIQLIIGLVTLVGAKIGGYIIWKRAGKPPIRYDAEGNMVVGDDPGAATREKP